MALGNKYRNFDIQKTPTSLSSEQMYTGQTLHGQLTLTDYLRVLLNHGMDPHIRAQSVDQGNHTCQYKKKPHQRVF